MKYRSAVLVLFGSIAIVMLAVIAQFTTGSPTAVVGQAQGEHLPIGFAAGAEPSNGLTISLSSEQRIGTTGATAATLELAVDPALDVDDVLVEVAAIGQASLSSQASTVVPVTAGQRTAQVPLAFSMDDGEGAISVVVLARAGSDDVIAAERAELALVAKDGELLADTIGVTALRVEAFDRQVGAAGVTGDEADERAALLDGETAENDVQTLVSTAADPGSDEVGIEGTVEWTDENGVQHPYQAAEIQIWEDDTASGDDLILTVFTDENGVFDAVVDNDDGFGQGGRDIYIRARTVGVGYQIQTTGDDIYSLRSPNVNDADDGSTHVFTMVGTNTDDVGRAMSIHQAMELAVPYVTDQNGGALRDLDVVYPNGDTFSFFNGTDLMIEAPDMYDWDVIHHEFGHFVMQELNIEDNPGGTHTFSENLSERLGKDAGNRLAWGEAWPTYFGTSLQRELNAAALNVPRVGDDRYQSFENTAGGINYSLESNIGGGSPGEDNEVSVQRALWDLYDDNNDDGDTDVELGDDAIWTRIDAADPETMSGGWAAAIAPMDAADRAAAACIVSNWGIAPTPTAPADGVTYAEGDAPPTFEWSAGGGGPTFLHDEFVVRFTTNNFATVLFETGDLTTTQFTPNAAQWAMITSRENIQWYVVGTQTDAPESGPYQGCSRSFTADQGGPDSIFDNPGCLSNDLPRNDDGSTGLVPLGMDANFFGTSYGSAYVNNNGNITFDSALSTFTPFPLLETSRVIIAPFFGDVDTRNSASGVVTYGQTTLGSRPAFCVNWLDVGYYNSAVDKTNRFQLMLVDRSNVAPGDFDIIFNYNRIEWEAGSASGGSGGLGGSTARVGYASSGFDSVELRGSDIDGALLDSNPATGLIHGSLNSTQDGRYIFRVRNGSATGVAVSGTVTNQAGDALAGAPVDVCAVGAGCVSANTNSAGQYRVEPVPDGSYTVRAAAPAGTNYNTNTVGPITVAGADVTVDIVLTGPTPPPAGTSISPSRGGGSVPVVYYNDPLDLVTTGCPGGTATYSVIGSDTRGGGDGDVGATAVFASGAMTEGPAGTYSATVPPLFPDHGQAEVIITIDCPGTQPDETVSFNIYIDPSGTVLDTDGNPIEGATATLFRSDLPEGPFQMVPDGSAIMSPANRTNPMITGADGRFGWDTIAGYYIVEATADGCRNPDNGGPSVETPILPVPPEQLNLELVLDCDGGDPGGDPLTLLNIEIDGVAHPGEPIDLTAEFSGGVGPYSTSIDWGDGTSCPGEGTCFVDPMQDVMPAIVDADHSYGTVGVYTVRVTITDSTGASVIGSVDTASCTIVGTDGRDTLRGTDGDDVICGLGGNDRMYGNGGNDLMIGGSGRDWMDGGSGNDELLGGREPDQLFGRDGDDKLLGGKGNDIIRGGSGNDYVNGRLGGDRVYGEDGDDLLVGERGADRMYGGNDNDELRGRRDNDILDGQRGDDIVIGGQGRDNLRGSDGNDDLFGGTGLDALNGGRGDDNMDGGPDVDICRDTSGTNTSVNCER